MRESMKAGLRSFHAIEFRAELAECRALGVVKSHSGRLVRRNPATLVQHRPRQAAFSRLEVWIFPGAAAGQWFANTNLADTWLSAKKTDRRRTLDQGTAAIIMAVKIGTRLTLVLLLALTPILAGYLYWSIHRSTVIYANDLARNLDALAEGSAPAMESNIEQREWNEVDDVLRRMSTDGIAVALLDVNGSVWRAPPGFPWQLTAKLPAIDLTARHVQFRQEIENANWLCRIIALKDRKAKTLGYLLVAQNWTDIRQDLNDRMAASVIAALLVVGVIVAIIPLAVRRYVSEPLAELSRKVIRLPQEEMREQSRDEVRLLTSEFGKLDEQLSTARRDLLRRHRRELELERSLQHAERLVTIGTLASGLAHEIGTPMGVIRSRAELLLHSEGASEGICRGLEIIISQIDRVTRIVRMLLDYARNGESSRTICDVRQIIHSALSFMDAEAARRNVTVNFELGDTPLLALCDPSQLQQVFVNLEMNALDAMTPGGGHLRVSAAPETVSGREQLRIVFEDNGRGVPPQYAARLFDPFFTTKEPGNGTGMGLAVSQSIMRSHNGDIGFSSGPAGSSFVVTIPMANAAAPAVAAKMVEQA
jgi:signal transduction histidine kinase